MNELVQVALKNRIISYVKINWGAPFILSFIFILLGVSYQEIIYPGISSNFAVIALLCLVLGVILQIVSFLKYSQLASEDSDDNSS